MGKTINNEASIGGYTDSRGEWRPDEPISFAPVFVWPPKVKQFFTWLFNYLFTWNLFYLGIVLASYYYLQPPLENMKSFKASWILTLFARNMALVWIIYGGWHWYLYILKKRGAKGKYSPRWQSTDGSTFLWNNQVYDNVFWACASAVPIWTAYEVVTFWLYANGKLPYLDFRENPVFFVLLFLLIPFWRELHFYLIHRLIHWKPLYKRIHYLHHYNINPGPWSGLAMHPIEHVIYFSVVLIHYIIPSHPIHFLFNSQHTALTPAPSHTGFEGKLGKFLSFGSYFHYLHHRLFECNYGESTIPLDKWFGIFEDGAQTQTEKQEAISKYRKLKVTKVVDESPEVRSFYFSSAEGEDLRPNIPGQHLTFKIPFKDNELFMSNGQDNQDIKFALRSYTISNTFENNNYRISVKKEPQGKVSSAFHKSLKTGDIIEARGPKGSFTYKRHKNKTDVFIAGGIGITPILSMLKSIKNNMDDLYLILAVKEKRLLAFKEEIEEVINNNPNIHLHVYLSREPIEKEDSKKWKYFNKRLDIGVLKSALPEKKHFSFYICGPEKMTENLVDEIKKWKGKKCPILTENFGSIKSGQSYSYDGKAMQIEFTKSGKTVEWDHEFRNILEFAESNGIRMEAGCMFGECGACSIKLAEGKIDYNYLTATIPAKGNILPCSCRPSSDLKIEA